MTVSNYPLNSSACTYLGGLFKLSLDDSEFFETEDSRQVWLVLLILNYAIPKGTKELRLHRLD